MANSNVFLKYDGTNLLWSSTQNGSYTTIQADTVTSVVNGGDTVTFTAVSGIDKIIKITDGLNGTPQMIKSKKGEDSNTVVATIIDKTVKGELDKYSIKFNPSGKGGTITIDPQIKGEGNP